MTERRLPTGGRIDRGRRLSFSFDGRPHEGFAGDTLASALLANGVSTVARSLIYDRPRGLFAAGCEEPNALVQLEGDWPEPMLAATRVELRDGLRARSLSGKGRLEPNGKGPRFDKTFLHCDILVVGAGPAGLAAALAAGRTGARVVLVDEQEELGGSLLGTREQLNGASSLDWVAGVRDELEALPETRVLTRATVCGYYDHNYLVAVERSSADPGSQRLWHLRARRVVLATGAHERSIVFAHNDRPGVMLAGAARAYVNRYAVLPGERSVVFTTNDSAYEAACELADAGLEVGVVVDPRPQTPAAWAEALSWRGIELASGHAVLATSGEERVRGALVSPVTAAGEIAGPARELACDLLLVSGGWNPVVHLFSQSQGRVRYDDVLAAFVPESSIQAQHVAGAARGISSLEASLRDGAEAGALAARLAGQKGGDPLSLPDAGETGERSTVSPHPLWVVPPLPGTGWDAHYVDLQRDATVADVLRATGAGLRSVEHVKRYTTIGTAHDQGKTSGVVTAAVVADALKVTLAEIGTTTYRPPYVPVSFAALAGRDRGSLYDPVRVTSLHSWHVEHGAVFENVGQWKRPWYYPRAGEDMEGAVLRECAAARRQVGIMDMSTLGKIDVQGADAAEFLDRVYTNLISSLKVGSIRYGLMCRADGMVFDDGTVHRLAEDRFFLTTTTGNAAAVLDWLEEWLQTEWPDLRVRLTSVTDHWATIAVVGPLSRKVLESVAPGLELGKGEFPFMTFRWARVAGVPARVCRVSFSGELAYEVNVVSWDAPGVWEALFSAGRKCGITPYGTETMHVLRAEKGYIIAGQDTDGTVTPQDLGMDWAVSKRKLDFIGKRSFARADTRRADRKQLVGLLPLDPGELLPEGAQIIEGPELGKPPVRMLGHVTSSYRSAALGRTFALALVRRGLERIGEMLHAFSDGRVVPVTVTSSVLYDPEGSRRDG